MTNKYKISDLAKDFGLKSKDLIAIITELTGSEKKSGATLNEEETALVFNSLTVKNSVKKFDEYFAMGNERREKAQKAREDEKSKKLAEQMAILEQLKAAAAAQNGEAPKAEPKKAEPKKEKKAENKKAEPKKQRKGGPSHAQLCILRILRQERQRGLVLPHDEELEHLSRQQCLYLLQKQVVKTQNLRQLIAGGFL